MVPCPIAERIGSASDILGEYSSISTPDVSDKPYKSEYLARILRCITINPFACLQSYSTYDGNFVSKKNKLFSDIAKRVGRKEKVLEIRWTKVKERS